MLIAYAAEHFDERDPGFVHAVGLAARARNAALVGLHVTRGQDEPLAPPRASTLLQRWKMRAPVQQQLHECPGHVDVVDELVDACRTLRPQLLVMATHARTGIARLVQGSVAEHVACTVDIPSLLVPLTGRTIVSLETGELTLPRVLVLALHGRQPEAQLAADGATWFLHRTRQKGTELCMLHVSDGAPAPSVSLESGERMRVEERHGSVESAVAVLCDQLRPNLLVMLAPERDPQLEAHGASQPQRVLQAAQCALLIVPANWRSREYAES